jgi:very-short-patch-repair endonuclease
VIKKCKKCKSEYILKDKRRKFPDLCPCCAISNRSKKSYNTRKLPYYKKIKKSLIENNYIILTTEDEYIRGDAYINCKCPNNHDFKVTYKEWFTKNKRCQICKEEEREKRIYEICKEMEFELLNKELKGPLKLRCKEGHEFEQSLSNFYKKVDCMICSSKNRQSKGERELQEFLQLYNISFISNDRTKIHPYELDLYLPNYKLAIEYNGMMYHDELNKDKKFHLMKTEMCEKQGIQLIHIFEDEWEFKDNREKVKNRLKSILQLNKKIYARKCEVKEISVKEAREFCNKYHIQNYGNSSIKLGLFYNDILVSVMTFSKLSISKGGKHKKDTWELNRFCSSNINVIGGAGKLLSYFKKNYKWKKIISYADRRWSNGNLYEKLGFDFIKYTDINYWYFNRAKKDLKKHHRFEFRKDKIKHLGKGTEWEIMQSLGWSRVWDCGSYKFEMIKNEKDM